MIEGHLPLNVVISCHETALDLNIVTCPYMVN